MAIHGFAADFHLDNFSEFRGAENNGVNYRAYLCLGVLEKFLSGVKHAHLCGDIFHHPYVYPQLLNALMKVIEEAFEWGLESLDIIPGNHDVVEVTSPGDHALGPLGRMPGVTVHDTPTRKRVGNLDIFYVPFPYDVFDFTFKKAPDVACLHVGIVNEGTSEFLRDSGIHYKKLAKWMGSHGKGDVRLIAAGDWHEHWMHRSQIVQLGSLCPHGWQDHGINRGHVTMVDDDFGPIIHKIHQVPGPRFLHAPSIDFGIKYAQESLREGNIPFVEVPKLTDLDGDVLPGQELPELADAHFRWQGRKRSKKVLSDSEAAIAARVEARRQSTTFEELVEKYCREKYPTRWNKVTSHIFKFLDHER